MNILFFSLSFSSVRSFLFVGIVADRIKAPFVWRPCNHNRLIYIQLLPSLNTLLRP